MLDDFRELFAELFTKDQQTALIIITVGVTVATQAFKKIYFGLRPVNNAVKKEAIIWLAAVSFGAAGGVAGYFVAIPPQPIWFWLFVGVASGGTAIGLFKLFVDAVLPGLMKRLRGGMSKIVIQYQILKMPKPNGKPNDPTKYYIDE